MCCGGVRIKIFSLQANEKYVRTRIQTEYAHAVIPETIRTFIAAVKMHYAAKWRDRIVIQFPRCHLIVLHRLLIIVRFFFIAHANCKYAVVFFWKCEKNVSTDNIMEYSIFIDIKNIKTQYVHDIIAFACIGYFYRPLHLPRMNVMKYSTKTHQAFYEPKLAIRFTLRSISSL